MHRLSAFPLPRMVELARGLQAPALQNGSLWLGLGAAAVLIAAIVLWTRHRRATARRIRELEATLAERTAKLRLLSSAVDQSAASIVITGLDGAIQFVNPAFTAMTGYTREEVLGQNPRILKSGLTPPETYTALWDTLARGEVWTGEFINRRKEGGLLHERATISPVKDEKGAVTHYLAVKDDITAQREAETALSESERLFRLAFENASVGMGLVSLDGRLMRVNRKLCDFFGYPEPELLQVPLTALVHPAYRDASPLFVQHLRSERVQHGALEQQYYHREGHLIWGLTSSTLVRDAQDTPLHYVAYIQDVTDRKQAELALRESEGRFAAILNSLQAAIFVADLETRELLFVNHELCRNFGVIEGGSCQEVFQLQPEDPFDAWMRPRLLTPAGEAAEPTIREYQDPRNGHWYQLHDEAIPWIDGRWVQLEVISDITSLKEAEEQVLSQQRQLATMEERERIGRELHDNLGQLLSYINVQTQAAQTLLGQRKLTQAQEALQQLAQAAQSAHSDLRQYILGIRGNTAPAPTQITFLQALQHYLDELEHNYAFQVELDLPEEDLTRALTPEVEGQLLRIIQEALANARKHSGAARARLSFDLDAQRVEAVVEDRGHGFDPANPVGSDPATPASEPHFGLGIMAERAAKVAGSVHVLSQPGRGTQVVIHVPRALSAAAHEAAPGLRVLLADDHHLFVEGLRTLLMARGVQVVGVARNGLEAQTQARALTPDIILMDVSMPVCDGIEATRRIKAEMPDIKVVMLTMAADDDTLFAALQAGATGYLLKNLQADEFHRLLQEMARGEAVLAPGLAQRVLQAFTQKGTRPVPKPASPIPELTTQQLDILDRVAQGLTYKEVGAQLHLSERTIRYHVGQILERLQLENKREAVAFARRRGLGKRG